MKVWRLAVGLGMTAASGMVAAMLLSSGTTRTVEAASHADKAAGETLFHEKGCEHCHGPALLGTDRGPGLTGVGRKLKGDAIRRQIVAGGGGMPAFADVLQPDEISRLVDFLSSQKKRVKVPKAEPGAPAPKLPANGSDDQG